LATGTDTDTPKIIVEIRDENPTTEQVVAYDRFWKMVVEQLLPEREAKQANTEKSSGGNLAA
jgi:hypothetical protein